MVGKEDYFDVPHWVLLTFQGPNCYTSGGGGEIIQFLQVDTSPHQVSKELKLDPNKKPCFTTIDLHPPWPHGFEKAPFFIK